MKKRLTRIGPVRAGIVLAVFYGIVALLVAPVILIASVLGAKAGGPSAMVGVVMAVLAPFLYAAIGFVAGVVSAALYNLIARFTGGLEFEVADASPTA